MTATTSNRISTALAFAAALALAGCGGSTAHPSTTATIGAAGGTLKAGQTTLTIPAGALSADTQVTLREAEPQHAGRSRRAEVEPHGQTLGQPAQISIEVDDTNAHVKMHDGNDDLMKVEVEVEHGASCATACASGQECDDGVCTAHTEDPNAKTCDPLCDSGQECDDGICKTHVEVETEHGGTPGTCTPACGSGMECDTTNGVCKPSGKK
jgi:uncharacterized protein YaaQ